MQGGASSETSEKAGHRMELEVKDQDSLGVGGQGESGSCSGGVSVGTCSAIYQLHDFG